MHLILFSALFVFALNIPGISFLSIVAALFILILKGCLRKRSRGRRAKRLLLSKSFLLPYLLLLAFSLFYYLTVSSFNLIEGDVLRTILLINSAYLVGYNLKPAAGDDKLFNYIYIFLALIAGGVLYVCLCVGNSSGFDLIGRSVPDFWKPSDSINGPVLDLYSMLGTCLLPFLLYNKDRWFDSRSHKAIASVAIGISSLALLVTILLQGRKAILSILVAFALTTLFKLTSISKKDGRNLYIFLLLIGTSILAFALEGIAGYLAANFDVFARFQGEGLESGRYQAWLDILESMPTHLTGGRSFPISEAFAHNIWLDVFYDGGMGPMLLLLAFHGLHFQTLFKLIRSKLPQPIIILIICMMSSIFIGFQGEPVLQASTIYFGITCCFFGAIARLSQLADEYNLADAKARDEMRLSQLVEEYKLTDAKVQDDHG